MNQNNNNFQQNGYPNQMGNNKCIDESFSVDYADNFGKELNFEDNNLNETILEQKMRNNRKNNQNQKAYNPNDSFALFNDYEIYDFADDKLNISVRDKNKSNYLTVRRLPNYSENEYLNIKKKCFK